MEQSVEKAAAYGYTAALSGGGFSKPAGWYLIDFPVLPDIGYGQSLHVYAADKRLVTDKIHAVGNVRLSQIFTVSDSALKNLTVGKVREIGESFCYNFINLESVEMPYFSVAFKRARPYC